MDFLETRFNSVGKIEFIHNKTQTGFCDDGDESVGSEARYFVTSPVTIIFSNKIV